MKSYITICFLLATQLSYSQAFNAKLSSDSILIGNWIELSYSVVNLEGQFEPPSFESFDIISGPNTSSSIQIINGDKTSKTTYSYYLKPTEIGLTSIPPAYLSTPNETLETSPLDLNVYPNPENIITPHSQDSESLFEFGNLNPWGEAPPRPTNPAPPQKPKRKYKKI